MNFSIVLFKTLIKAGRSIMLRYEIEPVCRALSSRRNLRWGGFILLEFLLSNIDG